MTGADLCNESQSEQVVVKWTAAESVSASPR